MAGLKSPARKRRDSSSPSTALIIFLVFFILLSIGLGVWGYYGYAGQEKLEATAKQDRAATTVANSQRDFNMCVAAIVAAAQGADNGKDPINTVDDWVFIAQNYDEIIKDTSKLKANNKNFDNVKKMFEALGKDLAGYDANAKRFNTTYREQILKLKAELDKSNLALSTNQKELKAANDKFETLQTALEKNWKKALDAIAKGNASDLKASMEKYKEMTDQFDINNKLVTELEEQKKVAAEEADKSRRTIKRLGDELAKLAGEKVEGAAPVAAVAKVGGALPTVLFLDVSPGRPLWDNPLGKVTRVDLQERHVYINIGSANGMKPEVTFNIFGAGWDGRADKGLKATIEVIRVLDANSSLARITSLYDGDGREIFLGDAARGRPMREAENALKEGDLLFNMFWGTRVAIAGNIRFAGQESDSPAEQMRIMSSFVQFLAQQGIAVDAYLDTNDAQMKGMITTRTRYLIRGDDFIESAKTEFKNPFGVKKDEPAAVPPEEKKEEMKKDDAAAAGAARGQPERLKVLNEAAAKMRADAADKGLLLVSTDNFLNVVGYRQPRSALTDVPGFRPSTIFIGNQKNAPAVQAAPAVAPPPGADAVPEKKADEKEKEKAPEKDKGAEK